MARRGGGFGLVILVVVVAIVVLLVARSWESVAPQAEALGAMEALRDEATRDAAREAVPAGKLPDLRDARHATDSHAEQVGAALDAD